jgi:hypothetical protein
VLGTGFAISVLLGALLWLLAQGAGQGDPLRRAPVRGPARPRPLQGLQRPARPPGRGPLLKAAAAAWQGRLRKSDLLARYGGEEFALLLPDCGLASGMEIAERLRTAQPEVTCSLGVAAWDGQEEAAGLVARADRALYAAREAGRDRCLADQAPATAATSTAPSRSS